MPGLHDRFNRISEETVNTGVIKVCNAEELVTPAFKLATVLTRNGIWVTQSIQPGG